MAASTLWLFRVVGSDLEPVPSGGPLSYKLAVLLWVAMAFRASNFDWFSVSCDLLFTGTVPICRPPTRLFGGRIIVVIPRTISMLAWE